MVISQTLNMHTRYKIPLEELQGKAEAYLESFREDCEAGKISLEEVEENVKQYVLSFMKIEIWNEDNTKMIVDVEGNKIFR